MNKNIFWPVVNTIGLCFALYINYLANALPIGGMNTGEISALYPNLFVPAGFTFSIWGVIYLSLLLFVGYQWYCAFSHNKKVSLPGPLFLLTCLANSSWIYAWHSKETLLSVGIMIMLLILLIGIYLQAYRQTVGHRMLTLLPFSLYTSWITIALIANVTAWLVDIEWSAWGVSEVTWTGIMIAVGTLLSMVMILRYGDVFFGLVTLWALFGIYYKRQQDDMVEASMIITICWISMCIIAVVISYLIVQRKTYLSARKHTGSPH